MLWFWVGASVSVGVLTLVLDAAGIMTSSVVFQAASGGGRETGLGQQPNWFAMHTARSDIEDTFLWGVRGGWSQE